MIWESTLNSRQKKQSLIRRLLVGKFRHQNQACSPPAYASSSFDFPPFVLNPNWTDKKKGSTAARSFITIHRHHNHGGVLKSTSIVRILLQIES